MTLKPINSLSQLSCVEEPLVVDVYVFGTLINGPDKIIECFLISSYVEFDVNNIGEILLRNYWELEM